MKPLVLLETFTRATLLTLFLANCAHASAAARLPFPMDEIEIGESRLFDVVRALERYGPGQISLAVADGEGPPLPVDGMFSLRYELDEISGFEGRVRADFWIAETTSSVSQLMLDLQDPVSVTKILEIYGESYEVFPCKFAWDEWGLEGSIVDATDPTETELEKLWFRGVGLETFVVEGETQHLRFVSPDTEVKGC